MRARHALALLIAAATLFAGCSSSDTTTDEATTTITSSPTAESGDASTDTTTTSEASSASTESEEPIETDEVPAEPIAVDWSDVDSTIADFVDANGLNGLGLTIVTADAGVVHENYWGAYSADRVSFIASNSKQVTSGILMRLDDEGVLDIDAPISDIVGDAWGTGENTLGDRTIAQMISNSAGMVGLNDLLYAPYLCQFLGAEIEECGSAAYATNDDDADSFEPDTEFVYGGAQWQLAGAVAEYASGETWAELVDRIYVQPCGLSDGFGYANHWAGLGQATTNYPPTFDADVSLIEPTENPHMEGGVYTRVPDYAELLLMYLRGGECPNGTVLSPDAIATMHVDRIAEVYEGSARGNGYGLGWWVDRDNGRPYTDGQYGANSWLDLDEGYGVYFVMEQDTNREGSALKEQLEPLIHELITG